MDNKLTIAIVFVAICAFALGESNSNELNEGISERLNGQISYPPFSGGGFRPPFHPGAGFPRPAFPGFGPPLYPGFGPSSIGGFPNSGLTQSQAQFLEALRFFNSIIASVTGSGYNFKSGNPQNGSQVMGQGAVSGSESGS